MIMILLILEVFQQRNLIRGRKMKDNIIFILLLATLFILTLFIIFRKFKIIIIFVIVFFGLLIGITSMYFSNAIFRNSVDVRLNTIDNHKYILDNNTEYLPLPPKTALKYRTSDKSAVYMTKSGMDEIVNLYRNISEEETFLINQENGKIDLFLKYNGYNFCICIDNCGDLTKMVIEDAVEQGDGSITP